MYGSQQEKQHKIQDKNWKCLKKLYIYFFRLKLTYDATLNWFQFQFQQSKNKQNLVKRRKKILLNLLKTPSS